MPVLERGDGRRERFDYSAKGRKAYAAAQEDDAKVRRRKTSSDPTHRPDLEKTATVRRCPPAPTRTPIPASPSPVASGRMALPTAPGGRPPGVPGMAGGGRPSPPGMPSPQGGPSIPAGGAPSSVMARPPIPGLAGGIPSGRVSRPEVPMSPAIQQILNQLRRRPPQ